MPVLGATSPAAAGGGTNGNPNFGYLQPIGDHCNVGGPGGSFTPDALSGTSISRHEISKATGTIAFTYSNVNGANPITLKAAVIGPVGQVSMTFNGSPTVTIEPGYWVMTDPVTCPVAAGGFIRALTHHTITSGQTLPGYVARRHYGQEAFTATDITVPGGAAADLDVDVTEVFAPSGVYGSTGTAQIIVGMAGDSVAAGSGDPTAFSYFERAASGSFCHTKEALGGESAQGFSLLGFNTFARYTRLGGCTHIIGAHGRNDLGSGTQDQLAARLLNYWTNLKRIGAKVYATTLVPMTTTTDGWTTVENQTVEASSADRIGLNNWIRGGCRVDGSGVAVFDGSGTPSPVVSGYLEIADVAESARDSGKWKPNYTEDGVHPTTAAHIAMSAVVTAWHSTLTL